MTFCLFFAALLRDVIALYMTDMEDSGFLEAAWAKTVAEQNTVACGADEEEDDDSSQGGRLSVMAISGLFLCHSMVAILCVIAACLRPSLVTGTREADYMDEDDFVAATRSGVSNSRRDSHTDRKESMTLLNDIAELKMGIAAITRCVRVCWWEQCAERPREYGSVGSEYIISCTNMSECDSRKYSHVVHTSISVLACVRLPAYVFKHISRYVCGSCVHDAALDVCTLMCVQQANCNL